MAVEVAGHRFEVRHGRFGFGEAVLYDGLTVAQRRPFAERIVPFWVMETGREIRYEVDTAAPAQVPGRIVAIRRNGREVFRATAPQVADAASREPDGTGRRTAAEARAPGRTGRYLGLPYDWRRPTWARFKARVWNPEDPRMLAPKAFGWGYDLNLHAVLRRLGAILGRDR